MKNLLRFIHKAVIATAYFAVLIQAISPLAYVPVAYAQEVTPTVTDSPTPTNNPTPTDSVTPTNTPTDSPTVTPVDTTTPTPTGTIVTPTTDQSTVTPAPTDITTPAVTPVDTTVPTPTDTVTPTTDQSSAQPSSNNNSNNNQSNAPPSNNLHSSPTPTITPTVTPDQSQKVNGHVDTTILKNVSAPSLDLSSSQVNSATLTTNKADYSPTDAALISGSNFTPNHTYQLTVSSTDAPATSTTVNVTTDSNGTFTYAYQLDGNYRPNYTVVVTDNGTTVATTTFTDSAATITLSPTSGPTGTSVSVSGSNFKKNDSISISFNSSSQTTTGSCTVSSGGAFGPCNFTVPSVANGSYTVTAHDTSNSASATFTVGTAGSPQLTVFGAGSGNGTVTSNDTNISCTSTAGVTSGTCTFVYGINNPSVTLTAVAAGGSSFSGWSGGGCSGTGTCSPTGLSGTSTVTLTATFDTSGNGSFGPTALQNTACMGDQPSAPSGLTCTANDIQIASVDNVQIVAKSTDGINWTPASGNQCDFPGQFIKFSASWHVQSTATSRYNVGLWFANQGQTSALHGTCSASTLPGSPSPFFEATNDTCGDIHSGSTGTVSPDITVVAQCNAAPGTNNLNLPYCTSWNQNEKANNACSDPTGTVAGSPSKCSCNSGFTVPITVPPAIEVIKDLIPASDSGKFNLQVNGITATSAANIGNGGDTHKVVVPTGSNTFGETAGTSTSLANYSSGVSCIDTANNNAVVATTGTGPTWTISNVTNGQDIVCTITNTRNNGTIELKKTWVGTPGQTTLNIGSTANGTDIASVQTGAAGAAPQTTGAKTVTTGTYYVSETGGLSNYTSALACTDNGNIVTPGTNNSVSVGQGHTVVCTFTNTLQQAHLTLVKTVTNDNGGTAVNTAWTLTATGNTNLSGTTGSSTVTNAGVLPGTYTLSETGGPSGYTNGTYSCVKNSGSPVVSNSITLANGDSATCTVNNNDNAPALTLTKVVSNTHGGTAVNTAWTLTATGASGSPTNLSGTTPVVSGSNFKADTYTLAESNGPSGYSASNWACTNGITVTNSQITLGVGQSTTCTITNSDVAPTLKLTKNVSNTHGGTATASQWTMTATGSANTFSDAGNSTTFHNVTANIVYTLSESGPSGYSAGSWSCDNSVTVSNGNQVTLTPGQNVTCSITNSDIASSLTLVKQVVGGTASASAWTLTATGASQTPTNLSGTTPVVSGNTFKADTYSLAESNGPTGYTASNWACTNGVTVTNSQITLGLNQSTTCTVTNTRDQGSIELKKVWSGTAGQTTLTIGSSANGTDVASQQTGANGAAPLTTGAKTVNTGTYYVSETGGLDNYTQALVCTDNGQTVGTGQNNSVTVNKGDTVVCTFTNTRQTGTLTVNKVVVDPFFTQGTFNLQIDGTTDATGGDGTTTGQVTVDSGNHSVSETSANSTDMNNYTSSYSCVDSQTQATVVATANGTSISTVPVAANQNVVCTFTNTRNSADLQVKKIVDDKSPLSDWGFSLDKGNAVYADPTTGIADFGQVATNVNHTITEGGANQSEYTLVSVTGTNCVNNQDGKSATANIPNGSNGVICTFENDRQTGTIQVKKIVSPSDGGATSWDFAIQGQGPSNTTNNSVTGLHDGDSSQAFTSYTGNYTITESGANLSGYTTTYSCTDGTNTLVSGVGTATYPEFTLQTGKNVVCTFTNTLIVAHLTLVKTVTDNNGGTAKNTDWTLSATGNTNISGTTGSSNVTNVVVLPGTYTLSESNGPTGYTNGTYGCVINNGQSVSSNSVTLAGGDSAVCTVNNDDNAPSLTLIKFVNGGASTAQDFTLTATGPTTISGAGGVVSDSTFSAGTYTLSESGPSGYTASDWGCIGGTQNGDQITLGLGDSAVCTITNTRDTGSITVHKAIDSTGNGTFVADDAAANTLGFSWSLDSGSANNFGASVSGVTTLDTHSVSENLNGLPYHFVGWYPTNSVDFSCTKPEGKTLPVSFSLQNNGDSREITLCNVRDTGTLLVYKLADTNGDGTYETLDPSTFTWGTDANNTTNAMGQGQTLTTGNYNVYENSVAGYQFTGWFYGNPRENDFSCTNLPEGQAFQSLPTNIEVTSGETRVVTLCNQLQAPILSISKTNDKLGQDLHAGDSVTYTITVTATQSAVLSATLTDLLPKGFHYRNGSATIDYGDGNGAQTFTNFSDDYHSPGIWNLGNIDNGQTLTLTLIADIDSSEQPGLYKDVAWAEGNSLASDTVLANAEPTGFVDTNFVGTQANVIASTQNGASYNVSQTNTQEVLGASTVALPETGAQTIWVIIAGILLLIGGNSVIIGFKLKRRENHA